MHNIYLKINQRRFRHMLVPGSPTAAVFMVNKVVCSLSHFLSLTEVEIWLWNHISCVSPCRADLHPLPSRHRTLVNDKRNTLLSVPCKEAVSGFSILSPLSSYHFPRQILSLLPRRGERSGKARVWVEFVWLRP